MQSLIYKAWQIGKLSDRQLKYFFIETSKRGWKKVEPVDVPHLKEQPSTLKALIGTLVRKLDFTEEEISEQVGLNRVEFSSWFFVQDLKPALRFVVGQR